MSDASIHVEGAARRRTTLDAATAELDDLTGVNLDAAQVVAHRAQVTAPRRTGRLAASVHAESGPHEATVVAGNSQVDYARPVHKRDPFITKAFDVTRPQWLDAYTDYLDTLVESIKGA